MLPCAILGDSLAAGVASFRPDCAADTEVGITSGRYVAGHLMAVTAETALISLGVNDGVPTIATAGNLIRLRAGIRSRQVFWLLPARQEATRATIRGLARIFGDRVIETRGATGQDGLHLPPAGYRAIAATLRLP